jgi:hypothetical protein
VAAALIEAIPAMALGALRPPVVAGMLYGVYVGTGRASAGHAMATGAGGLLTPARAARHP